MLSITITERGKESFTKRFSKPEITIGRVRGNDIVLSKNNVSKRHAKIVFKSGKIVVVDLRSTNGTIVNGQKITSPVAVKPTDKVVLGDFALEISESEGGSLSESLSDSIPEKRTRNPRPSMPPIPRGGPPAPPIKAAPSDPLGSSGPRRYASTARLGAVGASEAPRRFGNPREEASGRAPRRFGLHQSEQSSLDSNENDEDVFNTQATEGIEPARISSKSNRFSLRNEDSASFSSEQEEDFSSQKIIPSRLGFRRANDPRMLEPNEPSNRSEFRRASSPQNALRTSDPNEPHAGFRRANSLQHNQDSFIEESSPPETDDFVFDQMPLTNKSSSIESSSLEDSYNQNNDQQIASETVFKSIQIDQLPMGYPPTEAQIKNLERKISDIMARLEIDGEISGRNIEALSSVIVSEVAGIGVLEQLLSDKSVSEIYVNQHDDVSVRQDGVISRVEGFSSELALNFATNRLAKTGGISEQFGGTMRFTDGTEISMFLPPVTDAPVLIIRKPVQSPPSLDVLIGDEMLTKAQATELRSAASEGIIFASKRVVDAAIFVRALSHEMPSKLRKITIQQTSYPTDGAVIRVVDNNVKMAAVQATSLGSDLLVVNPLTHSLGKALLCEHLWTDAPWLAAIAARSSSRARILLERMAIETGTNDAFAKRLAYSTAKLLVFIEQDEDGVPIIAEITLLNLNENSQLRSKPRSKSGSGLNSLFTK